MNRSVQFAVPALCALSLQAIPQTTVQVNLGTVSFSPKNLTVQQGDTVNFNWINGFHNVVSGSTSGTTGTPDGAFYSGLAIPSQIFAVTFDGALLANFPKPSNKYDYYCEVHLPVMTASITVAGTSGSAVPYGTQNPAGSLEWIAGDARVGKSMTFAVDNPVDPTSLSGFAFLYVSSLPDPAYPAGTLIPGFGMANPNAAGELLLSILPPNPALKLGPAVWTGSGNPANLTAPIRANPALIGLNIYFQGAIVDLTQVNGIGLTRGWRATLGA